MLDGTRAGTCRRRTSFFRKKPGKRDQPPAPNHTAQEYRTAVWADQESMLLGKNAQLNWLFSIFLFTIRGSMLLSRPLY